MAIVWGSVSVRAQLGIDVTMSPSSVSSGTSSVTLTWKVYFRTDRGVTPGYSGTYILERTGTGPTGTSSESLYTSPNVAYLLWEGTQNVSTSYSGGVTRTMTAKLPQSGTLFDGAVPTITRSFTVPQRPAGTPSAPVSATAARVSDTQHTISWVRPANYNADATKWNSVRIARSTNGGAYVNVATGLSPSVTSWTDTSTTANNQYRWAVYGVNASNVSSTGTQSGFVSTTPAAPTNVVATKVGDDIEVSWDSNVPPLGHVEWEVYDNGVLNQTVAWNVTTVTVTSPNPAVPHTYTVRAKTLSPVLYSTFGTSNEVQLQAPPNAPTLISPVSTTVSREGVGNVTFQWQHNPVDTTAQTEREVQYRLVGAGAWTTDAFSTSAQTLTTPLAAGDYEWRARTKGADPSFGDYSAVATFKLSTKPIATIVYPVASPAHDEPSIEVEWGFSQAEGEIQSGWEVEIYNSENVRISNASGTGSATRTWTSPNVLTGLQTYEVRVRVREEDGLWSDWVTQEFDVEFDPPAAPTVTVEWNPEGYMTVTGQAVSDPPLPETVNLQLERSVDGGPFVTLATDLGLEFTYFDWTAPMVGYIQYRVTAFSALPSAETTVVVSDIPPGGCGDILLSGGPGFARTVRLTYYRKRNILAGRERVLNEFDGRANPVSSSGVHTPLSFSIEAALVQTDCGEGGTPTARDVVELSELAGDHFYRDHDGWTFPCHLSKVSVDPEYMGNVSFTVTRVDSPTNEQLLAIGRYTGPTIVEVRPGVYTIVGGEFVEGDIATWGLAP